VNKTNSKKDNRTTTICSKMKKKEKLRFKPKAWQLPALKMLDEFVTDTS
jgi:hypothetical protein